jgi:hypothetical protein
MVDTARCSGSSGHSAQRIRGDPCDEDQAIGNEEAQLPKDAYSRNAIIGQFHEMTRCGPQTWP